jgi:hypothetical protein
MPVAGAYLAVSPSSTHSVHALLPAVGVYLPLMHAVQVEADMREYFPGMHSRQKSGCVALVVEENIPAAQAVHTACFVVV